MRSRLKGLDDANAIGTIKANNQFENSISNASFSADTNSTIIFTSPEEGIITIAGEVFVIKVKATSKSTDGVIVSIIIIIIIIIIYYDYYNYYN